MSSTPGTRHADARLQRVITLYEQLAPADLSGLGTVYAARASFKDPFNAVQGVPAITRIFQHMFDTLDSPRFMVRTAIAQGDDAVLTWDFHCKTRGAGARAMHIHGASHLRFDADGRVALHRDYWDAAEELYEKLPLVGPLMRWLKRRVGG